MIKISCLKIWNALPNSQQGVSESQTKQDIVNYYLNKEFLNRRNFVKVTQTEEILTTYPCFKKPC